MTKWIQSTVSVLLLLGCVGFFSGTVVGTVASVFAADMLPSPPTGLEGDRNQLTGKILASKDETLLCQVLQLPGDDENIRYIKMLAAKRLGLCGTVKSISTLVPMLAERDMGMYARFAMEPMPFPEVDTAFRHATTTLSGSQLVGVLTSIGVRRDAAAVESLKPLLKNSDPMVVRATYSTIGHIGTKECGDILMSVLGKDSITPENDKAVCDAAMTCAEHLAAADFSATIRLYEAVLQSSARMFLKEAALFSHIMVNKKEGLKIAATYLTDENQGMFEAAVQSIRLFPAEQSAIVRTIVPVLPTLSPDRQGTVLESLAGCRDGDAVAEAEKLAQKFAKDTAAPPILRLAAARTLGTVNKSENVSLLLTMATESDTTAAAAISGNDDSAAIAAAISTAAFVSLVRLTDPKTDDTIVSYVASKGKLDTVSIRLAKERRITGITPLLEKEVANTSSPLRSEAIDAVGETATLSSLPSVAKFLDTAKSDEETKQIIVTLSAICARMPQKESIDVVAGLLTGPYSDKVKVAAVELMRTIGGAKAIEIVTELVFSSPNPVLVDRATQTLGIWDSPDTMDEIAAALLRVAKSAKDNRDRVRGVRGYIRLARQFLFPEDKRIAMIHESFNVAQRNEDKALIFAIFGRYPSEPMLQAAMKYVSIPTFTEEACEAAVAVAEKLQNKSSATATAMQRVMDMTVKPELKVRAKAVLDKQTK